MFSEFDKQLGPVERLQNWFRQSQILQGNTYQRNQISSLPLLQNYNMMSFFWFKYWLERKSLVPLGLVLCTLFFFIVLLLGNQIHKKAICKKVDNIQLFDPDPQRGPRNIFGHSLSATAWVVIQILRGSQVRFFKVQIF